MGLKKRGGCCAPFAGGAELGPRLTQCGLGWGLLPIQVVSWCLRPFGHSRHGPKIGRCAPYFLRELGPHLTQSRQSDWAYLHTKWHLNPSSHLTTTDMSRKLGGYAPLGEWQLGPHLTQCCQCDQSRGLPACQVSFWSIQPFGHNARQLLGCWNIWPIGHNRHGPKSWGLLSPFSWGAGSSFRTRCDRWKFFTVAISVCSYCNNSYLTWLMWNDST